MGGKKGGGPNPNSKSALGRARKEEQANLKKAAEQQKIEARIDQEWQMGANTKKLSRDEEAAQKADEAARKRQEKAALLAAEEAGMSSKGSVKKNPTAASKKKQQGKKKNDLSLLEDALVKGADKSVRKKKEEAAQKAQQQKELEAKAAAKKQEIQQAQDPLMANTNAMIGATHAEMENATGGSSSSNANNINNDSAVGRQANKARMEAEGASGVDGALELLQVSVPGDAKSFKELYAEFEAKMMPQLKEDYPGLRLSQYREKLFQLWKKSPDNPANQQQ